MKTTKQAAKELEHQVRYLEEKTKNLQKKIDSAITLLEEILDADENCDCSVDDIFGTQIEVCDFHRILGRLE